MMALPTVNALGNVWLKHYYVYRGSGDIPPRILTLGNRWGGWSVCIPGRLTPGI